MYDWKAWWCRVRGHHAPFIEVQHDGHTRFETPGQASSGPDPGRDHPGAGVPVHPDGRDLRTGDGREAGGEVHAQAVWTHRVRLGARSGAGIRLSCSACGQSSPGFFHAPVQDRRQALGAQAPIRLDPVLLHVSPCPEIHWPVQDRWRRAQVWRRQLGTWLAHVRPYLPPRRARSSTR
jgi:hypothetical protein